MRSMNFFLPPQYIVLEPAKMRYFQLKSTIYCVRVKLANRFEILYHVRSTASHRTAHTRTGSAVLPRRTASAQRIVCRRVPCQVDNAQLKPSRWETAVKRVVCTTDEPTACTAQRTYHSTVHRKRVPKSRVAYEGQVETQVYWCTLKIEHRAVRIQLHHRVTVVLPAPVV